MAEQELTKESLYQKEVDPKLYYDYEGRFIKQKLERDRVALLPRVLKPPMFAKGGHVLGDIRVFERLSVSPLSALTGAFIELPAGGKTDLERQVASQSMYVISGSGQTVQEGNGYDFAAEDVIIVPPYTTHQIVAGPNGARIWAPQVRFWHVLGLLWKDQLELSNIPEGTEPLPNGAGYRVPAGTLGLEEDLEVRTGTEPKRAETFAGRRSVTKKRAGSTKYHWFLNRLVEENEIEANGPRVIRGAERPWESTKQGKMRFYISNWDDVAAQGVDMMAMEIEPGGHSGEHRHIYEEMLLVLEGAGHDTQEDTVHPWTAGDIICIPPMTRHQHFNDGDTPARMVSVWSRQLAHEYLGGVEHISDASSWKG